MIAKKLFWSYAIAFLFSHTLIQQRQKTYGYQERDEVKRLIFKEEIALYVAQDLVYIDESGRDSREDYSYGWNALGNRFRP